MATVVKMPKIGLSEESSLISKWHKAKGDNVKVGEILFTVETDKSTFDVEAKQSGILLDIFFDVGDEVNVLDDVCVIGLPGEIFDSPNGADPNSTNTDPSEFGTKKIKISPRAKNLAKKESIHLGSVIPSGPQDRIIERDVLNALKKERILASSTKTATQSPKMRDHITGTEISDKITKKSKQEDVKACQKGEYTEKGLSKIRKIIGQNMLNSLSNTAQLTINSSFDATVVLAFRKKIKAVLDTQKLENITLNDIILFAVSRTLENHPDLNSHLHDDKMLIYHNVNLGVAVDTKRGLMVPTIFKANTKSLNEISKIAKQLTTQCRTGSINPEFLKGGTFTVTNMGGLGVETFTPILNPPQVGILGVGTITNQIKEIKGEYLYYPAMKLSLTFDHRAIDGAPAARFLQELQKNLEHFDLLLAR